MCNFLDSSSFAFDVIGWFTTQTDLNCFQIPGYILINDDHIHSIGGGVALLFKSDYPFSIRNDLKIDLIDRNTGYDYWHYLQTTYFFKLRISG